MSAAGGSERECGGACLHSRRDAELGRAELNFPRPSHGGACEVPHNLILPSHGRVEEHGRQRGVAPLRAALAGRIRVCRVKSSRLGRREARVSDVRHLPIYEEVAAAPS